MTLSPGQVAAEGARNAAADNMRGRIRAHPWSRTRLGPIEKWSTELSTTVDLCLRSRMCSCIYWGEEHLIIYNDAYASILGTKHPWALGRTVAEVWPEIIGIIGPLLKETLHTGATTGADDAPIFLNRSGYVEEFYCSFSYAPIFNVSEGIDGIFAILPETSERVIGERRLRTLQKLGAAMREAGNATETLRIAAQTIAENLCDMPFASLYLWREDDALARRVAVSNISQTSNLSPFEIELDGDDEIADLWRRARTDNHALLDLQDRHHPIPLGAWTVTPEQLLALALTPYDPSTPNALLLVGLNPHKRLDREHLEFFSMLADQISRSLVTAHSHEQEEVRAAALQRRARTAQEAERLRIARDLHDTLLQSIQGMRFLLEVAIERAKANDPSAEELFTNALAAADHAIAEGREVLSLLRSTAPCSSAVHSALSALCAELTAESSIEFEIEIVGLHRELNSDVWSEAYSTCREAVANTVRHAHARRLRLSLEYADPLCLKISDDGRGIEQSLIRAGREGHFGLQGMRERAAAIDAALNVESDEQYGTTVSLSVPAARAYCD